MARRGGQRDATLCDSLVLRMRILSFVERERVFCRQSGE